MARMVLVTGLCTLFEGKTFQITQLDVKGMVKSFPFFRATVGSVAINALVLALKFAVFPTVLHNVLRSFPL